IRDMIDPRASVLRDGRRQTVPAGQIVRGDIVLLEAGDRVPADLRLIRVRNLRVEEAVLTGESVPVDKAVAPVDASVALGDRRCLAFSGTLVAAGQGTGVVVATAAGTELGRISTLLQEVTTLRTPLLQQMDGLARQLTVAILGVSALTMLFAVYVRGFALADAVMLMVGLAVAAIPEGLPAVMSITLAIGVQRMARRHAIVRQLPAVETLGAVSVICSDKTGTLTRNEMTVRSVVTGSGTFEVTGVGYVPEGVFRLAADEVAPGNHAALSELLRASVFCNDAELRHAGDSWSVAGAPMEGALLTLARKAGLDIAHLRRECPRRDELPFDAQHRFMATLHPAAGGDSLVFIMGAPERILDMCADAFGAGGGEPVDRAKWHRAAEDLAARGERVLAFALKRVPAGQTALDFGDLEAGATLLGLTGFLDPPRDEAITAVADCRAAGIRVLMITGDHAVTAREIARQLGLAGDPVTLTGVQLDGLDEAGLRAAVRDTTVFARTTPTHKLRLVEALQAEGLTVAMTGDGVNDAPALKRADVGVAMGGKGTEVAKQAAEVVLADDNFASIVAAVREGRTVYDNLTKVIGWTLPTNGGEALTILVALAFGLALPMTPVQILWINMVTAVALGLTLAFEPTEPGSMRRRPRPRDEPLISGVLLWRIVFVSLLFVAGAFGVFFWAEARGLSIETARTLVVNTIVAMEIFYLFSVRFAHGTSRTLPGLFGTPAILIGVGTVVLAQALFTWLPALQRIFGSQSLGATDIAMVTGVGVALLLATEGEKRLRQAFTTVRAG
ncbi:MAG: HAD-IC family P-type ATPase, partial [Gammaproteobacteria bacterium]|nr:HAD-IC family P-type ATPase [Gammaproteobacteria bacterium]